VPIDGDTTWTGRHSYPVSPFAALSRLERSWHVGHIIKRRHYRSIKICSGSLHLPWTDIRSNSIFRILHSRHIFGENFLKRWTGHAREFCASFLYDKMASDFSWRLTLALFSRSVQKRPRIFSQAIRSRWWMIRERSLPQRGRFASWLFIGDEVNESGYAIYCHITPKNWFHHVATLAGALLSPSVDGEF